LETAPRGNNGFMGEFLHFHFGFLFLIWFFSIALSRRGDHSPNKGYFTLGAVK
jgi:hypothetical protein